MPQAAGTFNLSYTPSTSSIKVKILGTGTTTSSINWGNLQIWKPEMIQTDLLVDVCEKDNDRYVYGFNGQIKDNEWAGIGNFMEFSERGQDTRTGRFLAVDPIAKQYPSLTPYQYGSNNPIRNIDIDGLEGADGNVAKAAATAGATKVATETAQEVSKKMLVNKAGELIVKEAPFWKKALPWLGKAGGAIVLVFTPVEMHAPDFESKEAAQKRFNDQMAYREQMEQRKSEPQTPVKKKDEETITLYRGVGNAVNPSVLYKAAQKGVAYPKGFLPSIFKPHTSPIEHSQGDNESIFTSWTDKESIAKKFALSEGATEGVILEKTFKKGEVIKSPLYNQYQEGEYLVPGVVTGASVEKVEKK